MNEYPSNDRPYDAGYAAYPPGYAEAALQRPRKKKWVAALLSFFIPGTGHFYLGQMTKAVTIMMLIAFDICAIIFAVDKLDNVLIIVLLSLLLPIIYFYSLFDAIQCTDAVNDRFAMRGWPGPMYGMPRGYGPYPGPNPAGLNPAGPAPSDHAPEGGNPEYADPQAGYAQDTSRETPPPPYPQGPMPAPDGLSRGVNVPGVLILVAATAILLAVTNIGKFHSWPLRSAGSAAGAFVLIAAGIGLWIWERRSAQGSK